MTNPQVTGQELANATGAIRSLVDDCGQFPAKTLYELCQRFTAAYEAHEVAMGRANDQFSEYLRRSREAERNRE